MDTLSQKDAGIIQPLPTMESYIFVGRNTYVNDLWRFSPETLSWKRVKQQGEDLRRMCRAYCCQVGDRFFFLGGYRENNNISILDFNPSLKMLCKLAVTQHGLDQSGLTHDIRWELAAMTGNNSRKN